MTERKIKNLQTKMVSATSTEEWNQLRKECIDHYGVEAVITYVDAPLLRRWAKDMPLGMGGDVEAHMSKRITASLMEQYHKKVDKIKSIVNKKDDKGNTVYPTWLTEGINDELNAY